MTIMSGMVPESSNGNNISNKPTTSGQPEAQLLNNHIDGVLEVQLEPHKTAEQNEVEKLSKYYQAILERLLMLHDLAITESVRSAVRSIVVDRRNSSCSDWLRVIFKSLEYILERINVENIETNEKYLDETTNVLGQVLEVGNTARLIRETKYEASQELFNEKMVRILNTVSLESIYKIAYNVFGAQTRDSYVDVMALMDRMMTALSPTQEHALKEPQLKFWYHDALPLIFDTDETIRNATQKAFDRIIPFILISNYLELSDWPRVKESMAKYVKAITDQLNNDDSSWHRSWSICIQLLDVEIPRSASTLNKFLTVVEPALRSPSMERRAEAYLCWQVLVEVLKRHDRLDTEKRIKLVCTPLKALNVRTAGIAINKFHAWWRLICNVQTSLEFFAPMVLEPFLQFCFGPFLPTMTRNDITDGFNVRSYDDVALMACAALVCILDKYDDATRTLLKVYSLHELTAPVIDQNIFRGGTVSLIIRSCAEATNVLCKINHTKADPNCDILNNRLWNNLFSIINEVKNLDSLFIILDCVHKMFLIDNLCTYKTKLVNAGLDIIRKLSTQSFIFTSTDNAEDSEAFRFTMEKRLRLIKTINLIVTDAPYPNETTDGIIDNILVIPETSAFDPDTFIMHSQGLIGDLKWNGVSQTNYLVKFHVWTKITSEITSWIGKHSEQLKSLPSDKLKTIEQLVFSYLYAPISMRHNVAAPCELIHEQWAVLTKPLIELVGKKEFCEQSALSISKVLTGSGPFYQRTNEIIALILQYADYDYDSIGNIPLKLFDLITVTIRKDNPNSYPKDLNSIVAGLIAFRKALPAAKVALVQSKLNEIVGLLEQLPANAHRVDGNLIDELKAKFITADKSKTTDLDFVVVKKVWTMNPKKLTEHQREKMKERRCDIPALYNDMSQSQDSMSIQEWTPSNKAAAVIASVSDSSVASPNVTITAEKSASDSLKKSIVVPQAQQTEQNEMAPGPSQEASSEESEIPGSQGGTQQTWANIKNEIEKKIHDAIDDKAKQRVMRELSKIHIDAVDSLPIDSLTEAQRKTRSAKKEETPRMRQTRSMEKSDKPVEKIENAKTRRSISAALLAAVPTVTPPGKGASANKAKATPTNRKLYNAEGENIDTDAIDRRESPSTEKKDVLMPINRAQRLLRRQKGQVSSDSETESIIDKQNRRVAKRSASDDVQCGTMHDNKIVLKENSIPTVDEETSLCVEAVVTAQPSPSPLPMKQKTKEKESVADTQVTNDNVAISTDILAVKMDEVSTNHDEASDIELPETPQPIENGGVEHMDEVPPSPPSAVKSLKKSKPPSPKKSPTKKPGEPSSTLSATSSSDKLLSPLKNLKIIIPDIALQRHLANSGESSVESPAKRILNDTNMSALIYNNTADASHLNVSHNQSILTSPRVGDEKNQEFLNDTLNISPISHDNLDEIVASIGPIPADIVNGLENESKSSTPRISSRRLTADAATLSTNDIEAVRNNAVTQSPLHTPTMSAKQPSTISASTPILSSMNSPVSSKYRSQFTGRGAQLLKMINAKPSTESVASPTPINAITQLQTAPICDNAISPERMPNIPLPTADVLRTPQMDIFSFSRPLPSPMESPRVSILKRKFNEFIEDEVSSSPAHKKKRVSFNDPLSETKVFMIDDHLEAMDEGNDGGVPALKVMINRAKCKLRRKSRHDSARDINKCTTEDIEVRSDASTPQQEPNSSIVEDVVSINDIKEYLNKDVKENNLVLGAADEEARIVDEDNREQVQQEYQLQEEHLSLEVEKETEKDKDDKEENDEEQNTIINIPPMPPLKRAPLTLHSFSDAQILEHSFNILANGDSDVMARLLAERVSTIMAKNETFSKVFLDELASNHPTEFLEHGLERNEAAVVCDHLIASNSSTVVDRLAVHTDADEEIRENVIDGLVNGLSVDKRAELVDRLTDTLNQETDSNAENPLPTHVTSIATKAFRNNDMSPDEFVDIIQHYFVRRSEKHQAATAGDETEFQAEELDKAPPATSTSTDTNQHTNENYE